MGWSRKVGRESEISQIASCQLSSSSLVGCIGEARPNETHPTSFSIFHSQLGREPASRWGSADTGNVFAS